DIRCTFQSLFRMDRSVSFNIDNQLFVVSLLFNASVLYAILHVLDRREDRIDRNESEYLCSWLVFFSRKISATFFNCELDFEVSRLVDVADNMIRVEDLESRCEL